MICGNIFLYIRLKIATANAVVFYWVWAKGTAFAGTEYALIFGFPGKTQRKGVDKKMSNAREQFFGQFQFRPEHRGDVGVECEWFLVDPETRQPVPAAHRFLERLNGGDAWTYELGGCQVEYRTPPCQDEAEVFGNIETNFVRGCHLARDLGLELVSMEVGPSDMTLEVYPEPRYRAITQDMPVDRLRGACRVAGTHVHRGVGDILEAIRVYNNLIEHVDRFLVMGDHSQGERRRLFEQFIYPQIRPPRYESAEDLWDDANQHGFVEDPRRNWRWIRISRHGTVEVRTFGAPPCISMIPGWVREVREVAGIQ